MKKTRMLYMMALAICLIVLLAACGGGDKGSNTSSTPSNNKPTEKASNNTNNDKPASEPAASGKPVKLEIISTGNNLPSPDKDIIKQELDTALSAEINLTVYSSGDDYRNQLNVRMASGNFPDLFAVDRQQMKEFARQGLLLDLTPYLDQLDTTVAFIGEDSLKKGMVDDKVYAISKSPQIPYNTYWIRADWLDNLGLSIPTTLEELEAVATAFTENDPDGNGSKDTYGITGGKFGAFAPIFGAYGLPLPGAIYEENGQLVSSLHAPAMRDALAYIRDLIKKGVVDPEILANTGMQHQEKAIKGSAGIIWIDWPNITKDQFKEQILTVNPDARWVQISPPAGPGGQYDGSWDIGATPGRYAIPKALEKDPEKLQKVLELLNYVSDENGGAYLVQYGVEGRHYNIVNGKVQPTELMGEEVGYSWLYQFTGRPEMEYLQTKFAPDAEAIEFANVQPRVHALNGFTDLPEGYNPTDADRYMEEELAKFIYDRRDLNEYDDFLQTLETTMNYKLFVDDVFAQLQALGYGK